MTKCGRQQDAIEKIQGLVGDIHRVIELELTLCNDVEKEFFFARQDGLIKWSNKFSEKCEDEY